MSIRYHLTRALAIATLGAGTLVGGVAVATSDPFDPPNPGFGITPITDPSPSSTSTPYPDDPNNGWCHC